MSKDHDCQDSEPCHERTQTMGELDQGLHRGIRRDELVAALRPTLPAPITGTGRSHDRSAENHEHIEAQGCPCNRCEQTSSGRRRVRHPGKGTDVSKPPNAECSRVLVQASSSSIWDMKKLLIIALVAVAGAVIYKVLTAEIPIEEDA